MTIEITSDSSAKAYDLSTLKGKLWKDCNGDYVFVHEDSNVRSDENGEKYVWGVFLETMAPYQIYYAGGFEHCNEEVTIKIRN